MNAQKLYDLVIDSDRNASDLDLYRIAFLLASLPDCKWLVRLIREDAPRLADIIADPRGDLRPDATSAMKCCIDYVDLDGYTGRVANLLMKIPAEVYARDPSVVRVSQQPQTDEKPGTTSDGIAQRLYDLITAMEAVDTDSHIRTLAWALHYFGADILDFGPLVQDAPRLHAALDHLAPDPWFVETWGRSPTGRSDFEEGVLAIEACVEFKHGLLRDVAVLFKQLFEEAGAHSGADLLGLRHEELLPLPFAVKRRIERPSYCCVYIWMIGTCGTVTVDDTLAASARDWDKELVTNVVKPCVHLAVWERLERFIVCVAASQQQARSLIELRNREWDIWHPQFLMAQVNATDPCQVILLDKHERPRVVFLRGR